MKRYLLSWAIALAFLLTPLASNGRVMLSGAGKQQAAGGGGGLTLTFKAASKNDEGAFPSTRSYSVDVGTASATRRIVIATAHNPTDQNPLASVTVNGVSATRDAGVTTASTYFRHSEIWSVTGSSPGSGTQTIILSATGGGSFNFDALGVYVIDGASSTVGTPCTTTPDVYFGGSSASCTVTVASGGFGILVGYGNNNGVDYTLTVFTQSGTQQHSGAGSEDAIFASISTSGSKTPTISTGDGGGGLAVAVYGP